MAFFLIICILLQITVDISSLLDPNMSSFVIFVQDYHWWWRSFLTSGFTAVYLFIYAVHYFFSKLQIIGAASTILYFGYTMIMVLIFFLFTGEISDMSSLHCHNDFLFVSTHCNDAWILYCDRLLLLVSSVCIKIIKDHLSIIIMYTY